jgi:hypothetical protein
VAEFFLDIPVSSTKEEIRPPGRNPGAPEPAVTRPPNRDGILLPPPLELNPLLPPLELSPLLPPVDRFLGTEGEKSEISVLGLCMGVTLVRVGWSLSLVFTRRWTKRIILKKIQLNKE